FWGADEEISDRGSPRVIVYGYDGLPIQPVAPPSPEYIPLEDKHVFPAEEQPLPLNEDDETEDGLVDYPMDGGDDGDDDDDDSSGDDIDDEDEDDEDKE
ncbi:hypothetical protein Tco_0420264, partial [Tanacetum coccineum]